MFLPVHGIINPVPNNRFYQVLNDQCEPDIVPKNIPVTDLGVLAMDSECASDCSVSHDVLGGLWWRGDV